jgi:thermosome
MGGQPLFILAEDSTRTRGSDAQGSNIAAGRAIAEAVRTTLGPRGMDKLLVDSSGNVVITNDGATILSEMDIEHPAAEMLVDLAQAQEDEVGDGTTTAAVLGGQLLAKAESLLDDDVHPTAIVEGYRAAADVALETIASLELDDDVDDDLLRAVATSSMTGKGTGGITIDALAGLVVDAIGHVTSDDGNVERDDVHVFTKVGGSAGDTELVPGIVLDEERVHDEMPREVTDASVAILDVDLDVKEASGDVEYRIDSPEALQRVMDAEDSERRAVAKTIVDAGIDVVVCTDDVDDQVAALLADEGVLVFEKLSSDDARAVARATGSKRLGSIDDLDADDFGHVDRISVRTFGDDELAFVEGGAAADAVTLFVRGGTEHVVDELERALDDALDVVAVAAETGAIVPGAGATEVAIADAIRDASARITGRQQLAAEAFAEAVEVLPRTLAENAGMDPIDVLVDLRAFHEHGDVLGVVVDGESTTVADPIEYGVVDPAAVKSEAVSAATEAATMIVRIDDIIAAN